MNQHQNAALPQRSSRVKPNALGNQQLKPASTPNTTPPMMTLWKCATRNRLLCSWKSAGGTAISTPVMPPMTNVTMNPIDHRTGTQTRPRPPYIVNSQLKILTPVGTAMIMVMTPKKPLTFAPAPMVKKWCSQTKNDSTQIDIVAATMER